MPGPVLAQPASKSASSSALPQSIRDRVRVRTYVLKPDRSRRSASAARLATVESARCARSAGHCEWTIWNDGSRVEPGQLYAGINLEPGFVFSPERGPHVLGIGTFRYCNTIIVTETSCEVDSRSPRGIVRVKTGKGRIAETAPCNEGARSRQARYGGSPSIARVSFAAAGRRPSSPAMRTIRSTSCTLLFTTWSFWKSSESSIPVRTCPPSSSASVLTWMACNPSAQVWKRQFRGKLRSI